MKCVKGQYLTHFQQFHLDEDSVCMDEDTSIRHQNMFNRLLNFVFKNLEKIRLYNSFLFYVH